MEESTKVSVWLGVAASGITVLAFFGITDFDQLRRAVGPGSPAPDGNDGQGPTTGPITNNSSGLCIDTNGPPRPGVRLQLRDCGNYTGQSWSYDETDHHVVNPSSGLCLDTAGVPADGVDLMLNSCGNYVGQKWQYNAGTGYLTNVSSALCLDTTGLPAAYIDLVLNSCGNYAGMKWHM